MNRIGDFVGDIIGQVIAGALLLSIPWFVGRRRRAHQRLAEEALNKARAELAAQQQARQQGPTYEEILERMRGNDYERYAEKNDPRLNTVIDGGNAYSRMEPLLEEAEEETRKARIGRDAWRWFWLLRATGGIAVTLRVFYYILLAFWALFMSVGVHQFANDGENDWALDIIVLIFAGAILGLPVAAVWALAFWATHHTLKKRSLGT